MVFAQINYATDKVVRVIVAEQPIVDNRAGIWVQYDPELHLNYPGPGFSFDKALSQFIPVKDFSSWVLNEETCKFDPPFPMPQDENNYRWNESNADWEVI